MFKYQERNWIQEPTTDIKKHESSEAHLVGVYSNYIWNIFFEVEDEILKMLFLLCVGVGLAILFKGVTQDVTFRMPVQSAPSCVTGVSRGGVSIRELEHSL